MNKDAELLTSTIRARCAIDAGKDPCWIWMGPRVPAGYGFVGRSATRSFVHRLHFWGSMSFSGELSDMQSIHHLCGQRACVRIEHLAPTSSFLNSIEAAARGILLDRIKSLQDALRRVDPTNHLFSDGWAVSNSTMKVRYNMPVANLSSTERLRLAARREARRAAMQAHREYRFKQVIAVRALRKSGVSSNDALVRAGISRSGYHDWSVKLSSTFDAEEL